MDTVDRLNAVIDYVEKHITEKIDINHLAAIACCSLYDFQRMFAFTAEISITEYIRNRRLTLAGIELQQKGSKLKVIDAALAFGYESPISFARAFQAFHGITPSDAKKPNVPLRKFPRLAFQIFVKEVPEVERMDKITVAGKEYDAAYFGSVDCSSWSRFVCLKFWRLENENAYDDLKRAPTTQDTIPFDIYPMNVEIGQVFVIDQVRRNGSVKRTYFIAEGAVWEDRMITREILPDAPEHKERMDKVTVSGKEYEAAYFGEDDTCFNNIVYRKFWRLENAYDDFKDNLRISVLPYNHYIMEIDTGQVFVIEYTETDGSVRKRYYRSNGNMWRGMKTTEEFALIDKMTVNGKEYEATYFGEEDTHFKNIVCRKYWRLENAYDDFKDKPKTGNVLPYNNYIMAIDIGQVFVIEFIERDGSVYKGYYRSDGNKWREMPTTEEFGLET